MEQIKFECRSVTPMFMYGADGSTPELRPASIKGILRFWWRAIHGNLSLDELRNKEGEIFGSTKGRSSFTVRVIEKLECGNFQYLPHKSEATKKAFSPNQNFQVIFNANDTEFIKNLFTIATTLGSFGQRSRRGFGSIEITKIDKADFMPPKAEDEIRQKITDINSDFKYKSVVEYPYIKKIQIGTTAYSSFDDLLLKIGNTTHKFSEKGFGSSNPRYASPVYVSALKFSDQDYRAIITTLNATKSLDKSDAENFKEAIL